MRVIQPGDKVRIFRPTRDAWIGRVFLPVAFGSVLAVTAINLVAYYPALIWLIFALLPTLGLIGGAYAIPVVLGKIVIDPQGIQANVDGVRINLCWKEVRAAQITVQDHEPYLMLGVRYGFYLLPLRHFSISPIWEAVQIVAEEDAVHPKAEKMYERKDANEGISPDLWIVGVLRVADYRGLSIAAGLGVAVFLTLFTIAVVTHSPGKEVYLAFSVLYLLILTGIGTTELDPKGVTRRTILGTNRILWDDLSGVETGPFNLRIVLVGMRRQRMALFGPPMWIGLDAAMAVHFFALQISTRRLPRRQSITALFKISRNTRVEGY